MTMISNFLDECHNVARLHHLAYSTEQSDIVTIKRVLYFSERQHFRNRGAVGGCWQVESLYETNVEERAS
ncbi:hypothetical protein [Armatimonas sp.]|uniref:hypothetical protein n=1 Tax=Armatimonas sp. TaxID=1872638 RepID=UPI00286C5F4A|nr:hypothetical protein [Armatimonas sp.]